MMWHHCHTCKFGALDLKLGFFASLPSQERQAALMNLGIIVH